MYSADYNQILKEYFDITEKDEQEMLFFLNQEEKEKRESERYEVDMQMVYY